jgi:hypothetical protein
MPGPVMHCRALHSMASTIFTLKVCSRTECPPIDRNRCLSMTIAQSSSGCVTSTNKSWRTNRVTEIAL